MEQFTRPGTTRRFFCGSLLSDSREKWFLFRQVTWLTIGLSATKIRAGWARFRSPGIPRRSTLASVLYKHGLWRHRCNAPIFDGAKWSTGQSFETSLFPGLTYSGDSLRLSDFRCLMLEMLGRVCLIWLLGTGPDDQLQWGYSNCMSFPGIPYSNLTEHIWTYQVQDCSFQVIPHVFQFLGWVGQNSCWQYPILG